MGKRERSGHNGSASDSGNRVRRRKGEALVETLKLPKDICMGAMKVTMTGSREAWIENYRGILEYTENLILLQGKTCQVCFEGTGLSIDYYTNEDMKVSGCIACVRYL